MSPLFLCERTLQCASHLLLVAQCIERFRVIVLRRPDDNFDLGLMLVVQFKFTARPGNPEAIRRDAMMRMVRTFPNLGIEFGNATAAL